MLIAPKRPRVTPADPNPIDRRHGRVLFRFVVRNYQLLVIVSLSAIVLGATMRQAPAFTIFGLVIFWTYSIMMRALPRPSIPSRHPATPGEVFRAMGHTLGATGLLFIVYRSGDSSHLLQADTLWLLYLLPI